MNSKLLKNRSGTGSIAKSTSKSFGKTFTEKQSAFFNIKEAVSKGMYEGIHVLLKGNENETFMKFAILNIVHLLQMLSFTFNTCLTDLWRAPSVMTYLYQITSSFRMVYWLEQQSWNTYITVVYIFFFLLFSLIITFMYVAYQQKQRKPPFKWSVEFTRHSCSLLVTIAFIPILELFLMVSSCQYSNQVNGTIQESLLMHTIFPNLQCFTGMHIIHTALSFLAIIMLLATTYIVTRCFYESRMGKNNVAIMHSRTQQNILVSNIVYVAAFTYWGQNTDPNEWFLTICLVVCSSLVLLSTIFDWPYYQATTQRTAMTIAGLYAWTNMILLFSLIMVPFQFTAGLAILVLCSPFIVFILWVKVKDHRRVLLMKKISTLHSAEEYRNYTNYYLTIVESRKTSSEAEMILKGYLNHHAEYCQLNDCPLRAFKKMLSEMESEDEAMQMEEEVGVEQKKQDKDIDNPALLMAQAKNLFANGVKRFPENVELKLDYAWFLISQLNDKREARNQLNKAQILNCSFEEQSKVYHYKLCIEEDAQASIQGTGRQGGGQGYLAAVNSERLYRQLKIHVEKCALLHFDFWTLLIDEKPDLMRLRDQGLKIKVSLAETQACWNQLYQSGSVNPKALKLYASFQHEIMHDKATSDSLLSRIKEIELMQQENKLLVANLNLDEDEEMDDLSADCSPIVYISAELENLGIITHCNMNFCKIFGYAQKDIIIGYAVDNLMPDMFAKDHNSYLKAALKKHADHFLTRDRLVFGKNSAGYVFPVSLTIKNVPSVVSGPLFAAQIKIDKQSMKGDQAFLLLDRKKRLVGTSPSCISLLGLDLVRLESMKAKIDIQNHLPGLFGKHTYNYQSNVGAQIEYTFPVLQEASQQSRLDRMNNWDENQLSDSDEGTNHSVHSRMSRQSKRRQSKAPPGLRQKKSSESEGKLSMIQEEEEKGSMASFKHLGSKSKALNRAFNLKDENSQGVQSMGGSPDTSFARKNDISMVKSSNDPYEGDYMFVAVPSQTKKASFQCNFTEIRFSLLNVDGRVDGYYVKLESIQARSSIISQEVPRIHKCTPFQFSYDPVNSIFKRELRDKENELTQNNYSFLEMKKLKEKYTKLLQQDHNYVVPKKIQNLTYIRYLNYCQKQKFNFSIKDMEEFLEAVSENEQTESNDSDSDEEEVKGQIPKQKSKISSKKRSESNIGQIHKQVAQNFIFITKEQSKEFLQNELKHLIDVLRLKHELWRGVHTFQRREPNRKARREIESAGTDDRFKEVPNSPASLFTNRSQQSMEISLSSDDEDGTTRSGSQRDQDLPEINVERAKRAVKGALDNQTLPVAVTRLSRIATVFLLGIIALAVVEYSTVYSRFQDIITNYQMLVDSQLMVAEIQKVAFNVRTIIMMNQKIQTVYLAEPSSNALFVNLQQGIQDAVNQIQQYQNAIDQSNLQLSDQHSLLMIQKSVPLYFLSDPSTATIQQIQFSLIQAMLQIQASIFSISTMTQSQYLPEYQVGASTDLFFILYNSFNEFLAALTQSSYYYVNELSDRSTNIVESSMVILIVSVLLLSLMVVILIPVVSALNEQKIMLLLLFCDINDKEVVRYANRCDRFVQKMQVQGEVDDEIDTVEDEEEGEAKRKKRKQKSEEDEKTKLIKGRDRRKQHQSFSLSNYGLFIKFTLGMLVISIYFIQDYANIVSFSATTQVQLAEMNRTISVEPFEWFVINAQRELFYNQSKPMYGGPGGVLPTFNVSMYNIYLMSQITRQYELFHISNVNQLPASYNSDFQTIMYNDICSRQTFFPENPLGSGLYPGCESFAAGVGSYGLLVLIIDYTKSLRLTLNEYMAELYTTHNNYTAAIFYSETLSDVTNSYLMLHEFIEPLFRYLTQSLLNTITDWLNVITQRNLILLIVFVLLLMLAYVSIWLPLINSLNQELIDIKHMLLIVPLDTLVGMRSVAKALDLQDILHKDKPVNFSSLKRDSDDEGPTENSKATNDSLISNRKVDDVSGDFM